MVAPNLLQQVRDISQTAAQGYISDKQEDYKNLVEKAEERAKGFIAGKRVAFATTQKAVEELNKEQIADMSKRTALDALVLNAVRFAENKHNTPSPQEQIQKAMEQLRAELEADGISEQEIDARIAESLEKIVISMTHTAHPTIFHTLAAKRFQQKLTQILEANSERNNDGTLSLTDDGQDEVNKLYNDPDGFIAQLKSGKASITQLHQVTVQEEAAMEADNWKEISEQINDVITAWNDYQTSIGKGDLIIDEVRRKTIIEKRTWLRSADADGRDKSTAEFLYQEIQRGVENGQYTGEKLDPRQNSEVHENYISALIQVKYRNSATERYGEDTSFRDFCNEFLREKEPKLANADQFIFQQLTPENQAEFISLILENPSIKLVPDQVKHSAFSALGIEAVQTDEELGLEYELTPDFEAKLGGIQIKQKLLERYKDEIQTVLKDPNSRLYKHYAEQLKTNPDFHEISYKDMIHVTIPFKKGQEEPKVSLRGACDAVLDLNGFHQEGLEIVKTERSGPKAGTIFEFWKYRTAEQLQCSKFLQRTSKWDDKNKKQVVIDDSARDILLGTTKRMLVFNDAVEKYGDRVADRYQIANFEKPADFLIAMKLFEESGLVTMKDGKVEDAKLDIMPLLETEKDLKGAKEIFEELLKNDAARSFWEKRGKDGKGKATIMLGFSDGSASAGNFASLLAVYNTTRELTELFAQHGIEVEFFEGRGRGTDRGGTLDPAERFELLPPEVTCKGRYDATIQADLPMDMAASPAYGKNYLTSILTNTVKYYVKGKETRDRLAELKNDPSKINRAEGESVLQKIADESSKVYNTLVRANKGAYKFLMSIYDNNQRTSRAASRVEMLSEKDMDDPEKLVKAFDKLRAIQKEYRTNGIDLPFHHAGLKEGMYTAHSAFGAQDFKVATNLPFFQAFSRVAKAGLRDFDPEIAEQYGKTTNTESFVSLVSSSISGALRDLNLYTKAKDISKSTDISSKKTNKRYDFSEKTPLDTLSTYSFMNAIDQFAHALTLRFQTLLNGKNPEQGTADAATYRNLLFVNAQEVNKLSAEPVKSKVASIG